MKTLICSALIYVFSGFLNTQAQYFSWAKKASSWAYDYGTGLCIDDTGNVYVTGEFELTADFAGSGISVISKGLHDIFLAKYTSMGNLLWVRTAGGIGGDGGYDVDVDASGNIYVTGEFESTSDFSGTMITSAGDNDMFIAKYNSSGILQWVKNAGGIKSDRGRSISVNKYGDIFITGEFKHSATFDNITLTSSGEEDIYIAKYNTSGVLQWVKQAGGLGVDEGRGVATDYSGNVYCTGFFSDIASFGSNTVFSAGGQDAYIAKYDAMGNLQWVQAVGGKHDDAGRGITIDNLGKICVVGDFKNTINLGNSYFFVSSGKSDIFIASYDSNGNILWATKAGGNSNDYGAGISSDLNSNVYITGAFTNTCNFGNFSVTAIDSLDIFIAACDPSGTFQWVQQAGGTSTDLGRAIIADKWGGVYVTGLFKETFIIGNTSLVSSGNTDFFLARYFSLITSQTENYIGTVDLKIYPSISSGTFKIVTHNNTKCVSITISDMLGKVIQKNKISNLENSNYFDLSNLEEGIYLAIIENEESANSFTQKLIIQK